MITFGTSVWTADKFRNRANGLASTDSMTPFMNKVIASGPKSDRFPLRFRTLWREDNRPLVSRFEYSARPSRLTAVWSRRRCARPAFRRLSERRAGAAEAERQAAAPRRKLPVPPSAADARRASANSR